ncbi:helix-turn-helix transcriptional regulator [Alteromonas sp. RKMC-009]|uniref:helix-turn-helix transcriptional regulator n=1 Tax=Alteromonas sp. RKMC-009 TaxID=2267264 RepID=UPI000E67CEC2|nr:AlpA family phage regulatory protein [Alteromonas sp. RKMC-009]AYA64177.1 AlpA family phage regulatory protein [Alteromonas sp. RKMC-009]
MTQVTILKLSETLKRVNRCKTSIWNDVKEGIFPPPIKTGKTSAGYIESEVDAVLLARSVNFSDDQLKDLVEKLVQKRQESASRLIAELMA